MSRLRLSAPPSPGYEQAYDQIRNSEIERWANGGIGSDNFDSTAVGNPLAIPVLRADFGGTILGGTAAGSYVCNKDSTPKLPATLANFRVETYTRTAIDDPPNGYKIQWNIEVDWKTNATAPTRTWTWALWELTAVAGGAGGYTETGAASFTTPTTVAVASPAASAIGTLVSGWNDHGVTGDVVDGKDYAFGVNISGGASAANSALSFTGRLFRRFVPA